MTLNHRMSSSSVELVLGHGLGHVVIIKFLEINIYYDPFMGGQYTLK